MKKLFTAIRKGDLETVKALIEKKPELINTIATAPPKSDAGESLLQVALKTGHLEIADYLINKDANVNFIESEACGSPWRAPVVHDAINAAIMNCRWNTYSSEFGLTLFSTKEKCDFAHSILRKMLERGSDVNAIDSLGNTGIWRAVIQASQIIPRMDPVTMELSNDRLFTPELEEDLRRVFSLLLKHGADLSYVRPDLGLTVLEMEKNKLFLKLI